MVSPSRSQGGDLRKAIMRDSGRELAWGARGRQVAMDITRGLHFLHTSGVIHRRAQLAPATAQGLSFKS